MPPTRNVPAGVVDRDRALLRERIGRHDARARRRRRRRGRARAAAAVMPARDLVACRASTPITPVDATSTCSASQPTRRGRRVGHRRARRAMPSSPVQALAQPLLTTIARARAAAMRARCSRETSDRRRLRLVRREHRRGRRRRVGDDRARGRARRVALMPQARRRRGSRAGAVTPPSMVADHGDESPSCDRGPRRDRRRRRASRTASQRQHHRVLAAAAEQRAADAVVRDLLRQPQCAARSRSPWRTKKRGVVRERAQRLEAGALRASAQLVDEPRGRGRTPRTSLVDDERAHFGDRRG